MQLRTTTNKNLYRGPSSSHDFNEIMQDIHYDLAQIADGVNNNETSMKRQNDILLRENHYFQARLAEVVRLVEETQWKLRQTGTEQREKFLRQFYDLKGLRDGDPSREAFVDMIHGLVTPAPAAVSSKLSYMTESGTVLIPQDLEIMVRESNDSKARDVVTNELIYEDIASEGLEALIDRNKSTFWIKNSVFREEEAVSEVYGEVHIKLPASNMTSLYANTLSIRPYPEGSMTIQDIFYKGQGDQWARLPNFPTKTVSGVTTPVPIEKAMKTLLSFSQIEITELRIFFSQPYWFQNEKQREFTYGFQDIELEHRVYTDKDCEFVSVYSLPSGQAFSLVKEPVVKPGVGTPSNLTGLVTHELYYDAGLTSAFSFEQEILAPIQTIYVKTVLKKQGDLVPVVKQLELEYEYKRLGSI